MSLAFHASPPPGEWLNDPNGLVHADGQWRLFVQHRADAPAFRATGWARLSSPDLLNWTWDGPVIVPDGDDWAYSGSVQRDGADLAATYTVHDAATGLERQVRRVSADAGATWSAAEPLIAAAHNRRDPFVFDGSAAMLLACPCDWNDPDTASHVAIWRCRDGVWSETGRIGPWHPPGVMWEVPVIVEVDGRDVLLISTIDRRGGGADCAVHAWAGRLGPDGFARDPGSCREGQRLDLGPDFYAAMAVDGEPLIVGWLSSWATAATFAWPGFAGGIIGLPRRLSLSGGQMRQHVALPINAFSIPVPDTPVAGRGLVTLDGAAAFTLAIGGAQAAATITADPRDGTLTVERIGAAPLQWRQSHAGSIAPCPLRTLTLFVDGPAIELFIAPDGAAVSIAMPVGDAPLTIACHAAGVDHRVEWNVRPTPMSGGSK